MKGPETLVTLLFFMNVDIKSKSTGENVVSLCGMHICAHVHVDVDPHVFTCMCVLDLEVILVSSLIG